jgi:hypothetical protein
MPPDFPDSDFLREVRAAFDAPLREGLLEVESSLYSAEALGSGLVELSGKNVLVRVVRDKGDVFAEAAANSKPAQWWPFEWVLDAAGVKEPPPWGFMPIAETARLFAAHRAELEECFSSENRKRTLEKLQAISVEAGKRQRQRQGPAR